MKGKIKGSTILVTGGGGFIGSHVVDRLIRLGAKTVVVLDDFSRGNEKNLSEAKKTGRVKTFQGDIRDFALVKSACQGVEYICHEVTIRLSHAQDDPRLSHDVIATGSLNVLEAAVKNKVRKVIYISSGSVYGEPNYLPIDEDHPLKAESFYAAAKIYVEFLLRSFHHEHNLGFISLRPFHVYGPRVDIKSPYKEVIPSWLESIRNNQPPIIHGDGKRTYGFTYVDDVVTAHIKALESSISEGFYNVGAGEFTTLSQLAQLMLKVMGSKLNPVYIRDHKMRGSVARKVADTRKAEKDLRFKAQVSLEDGLRRLFEWRNSLDNLSNDSL